MFTSMNAFSCMGSPAGYGVAITGFDCVQYAEHAAQGGCIGGAG
jgi:hypothetical protein